jgi:hypothetical protein
VFLCHEALLVLLGQRGPRLRERRAPAARRTLAALAPVALTAGLLGLALASRETRWAATALAPLALLLVALIAIGREKTTLGELVAASTAAAAAVPVAVASGVPVPGAAIAWLVWTLAFGAATGGVRWLLSRHKGKPDRAAPALLVVTTVVTLAGAGRLTILLAAVPQLLVAWGLVLARPHARHLKRVGWTLMVASLVTAVALVVALR